VGAYKNPALRRRWLELGRPFPAPTAKIAPYGCRAPGKKIRWQSGFPVHDLLATFLCSGRDTNGLAASSSADKHAQTLNHARTNVEEADYPGNRRRRKYTNRLRSVSLASKRTDFVSITIARTRRAVGWPVVCRSRKGGFIGKSSVHSTYRSSWESARVQFF